MNTEDKEEKQKEKKPKKTAAEKIIDDKIKALKKFKINVKSNYINKDFFTNGNLIIFDRTFEDLDDELRVIDKSSDFEKTYMNKKIEEGIEKFNNIKFKEKKFTRKELKDFLTELKKISFDQIQICNGKFKWFDTCGYHKFKCIGEGEIFKDIILDFDTDTLKNIMSYFEVSRSAEITLYSNKTFLIMKSLEGISLYARGVKLAI